MNKNEVRVHEAICNLFKINSSRVGVQKKITVRCIFHDDAKASGVIYFSDRSGGGWYHCSGCHKDRTLKQVLAEKGVEISSSKTTFQDYYPDESINHEIEEDNHEIEEEFKPGLTDLNLLENLYESKGININTIVEANGFVKHDYLVLPYGLRGKSVARYLGDNKKRPRFLQSEGEHKGFLGEEYIRKNKILILVEGITCWLIMKQLGFTNVIASFGAELSDDQAYMLRGKTVFIMYDRDFSGFTGARDAEEKIAKFGGTPINTELYEPNFEYGENKIDVNYLVKTEPHSFVIWLSNKMNEYNESDEKYIKTFKEAPKLKFYSSDLSILNFTQGLYFMSGDSGVGKTTMGVSLLDQFTNQGARTLYVNYDLPKAQIVSRLASRASEFTWTEIEADHSILEEKALKWLEQKLKRCKIMNDLTISEIVHAMQYFECVIVDYFQQIPFTGTDERIGLNSNLKPLSTLTTENSKTVVCISRESLNGNPISGTGAAKYNCQGGVTLKKVGEILMAETFKNTRGVDDVAYYKVDYGHQRIVEQTSYAQRIQDPKVQDRLNLV